MPSGKTVIICVLYQRKKNDPTAINESNGCQNNNSMTAFFKKSEVIVCQVCLKDNKQTFKALVYRTEFRSIRVMLN